MPILACCPLPANSGDTHTPRWLAGIVNLGLILQSPFTPTAGVGRGDDTPAQEINAGDREETDTDYDILSSSTGLGEPQNIQSRVPVISDTRG